MTEWIPAPAGSPVMSRVRAWADAVYVKAERLGRLQIRDSLIRLTARHPIVDIGCGDGRNTMDCIPEDLRPFLFGVDIVAGLAVRAKAEGLSPVLADLDQPLPFADGSLQTVVTNQVIEHVSRPELFIAELRRITARGGIVIVGTENVGSWDNVAAVALGWQPFSTTNCSTKVSGIGNPLATKHQALPFPMHHRTVFAYRGLRELLEVGGLNVLSILGAGYFPLPSSVGVRDPRHARFITAVCRVP